MGTAQSKKLGARFDLNNNGLIDREEIQEYLLNGYDVTQQAQGHTSSLW